MTTLFHRFSRTTLSVLVLTAICTILTTSASACPFCSQALAQQNGDGLTHGYFLSIVGLVSLPFLLLGGIIAIVFRSWWTSTHPGQPFHYLTALRGLRR